MAQADTNKGAVRHSLETTWGETPSGPNVAEVRFTAESLQHQKQTVVSQEVRSDRQVPDVLEVGQSAAGDIRAELTYGSFESFFQTALASTIASALATDTSATVTSTGITVPAGGLDSFVASQYVRLTGAVSAIAQIASVTNASTVVITGTTLTPTVGSITVNGRMLRNGTTERSHLIEVGFTDVSAVKYFTGMEVGQLQLNVASQQIVTAVFSFMGKAGYSSSGVGTISSAITTANTNTPMTAAVNVGTLYEGAAALSTQVQGLTLNLTNNLRQQPAVGSKPAIGIGQGQVNLTGTLNAYFEDTALQAKFLNHTATSFSFRLTDTSGNVMVVTVPSIYYAAGTPQITGVNADVFQNLTWTARRDPTTGCMVQMDFLPATP